MVSSKKQTNELIEQFKLDRKLKKRKKANVGLEVLIIAIMLFVGIIVAVMGNKFLNGINDQIVLDDNVPNETKIVMAQQAGGFHNWADAGLVLLFAGLWIVTLVSAFFVDTHPVFLIAGIFLLVIVLLVLAILGNSFEEITEDADLSSTATDFPLTNWLMTHLLIVGIAIGGSMVIALYAKSRLTGA